MTYFVSSAWDVNLQLSQSIVSRRWCVLYIQYYYLPLVGKQSIVISLSVNPYFCRSACGHISETTHLNFTKFSVYVVKINRKNESPIWSPAIFGQETRKTLYRRPYSSGFSGGREGQKCQGLTDLDSEASRLELGDKLVARPAGAFPSLRDRQLIELHVHQHVHRVIDLDRLYTRHIIPSLKSLKRDWLNLFRICTDVQTVNEKL